MDEYNYNATINGGIQLQIVVKYTNFNGDIVDEEIYQILPDGTESEIFPNSLDHASIIADVRMSDQFGGG